MQLTKEVASTDTASPRRGPRRRSYDIAQSDNASPVLLSKGLLVLVLAPGPSPLSRRPQKCRN